MKPSRAWSGRILHVLHAEEEKTLARVATFLSDPSRSFVATLRLMITTRHLGDEGVHPVVASAAREVLNKSENERSGVLSTAMSFLGRYRDPTVAAVTSACDWRIDDLLSAEAPVSLYLVVPPSDISRTKPLVRLVLNQIGRRLTERHASGAGPRRQLLMMFDEFPALGRFHFFENAFAFMARYGVRAFLIAQSLNQIVRAHGENNAILDIAMCAWRSPRTTSAPPSASPWRWERQRSSARCATMPGTGLRPGSPTSWSAARKRHVRC